jgi:glycosyltransferase involved in cell wall biosynthesis
MGDHGPGPSVLSLYEGFFSGGARILHTAVVRSLDATTTQRHAVLSLTDRVERELTPQPLEADTSYRRLTAAGVPVTALHRTSDQPLTADQLATLGRAVSDADVVLSLKEQPLVALSHLGFLTTPVLTCLHRSDPEHQGVALEALVRLHDQGLVRAAVCCARSTQAAYHAATGIPLDRLPVVPNGVDLHRFAPDPDERARMRAELGIPAEAPVVLLAARFDEMKDVPLFVRAARHFVREHPGAHLVLCGAGMVAANPALTELLDAELGHWSGLASQVHLLGIRRRMAPLYNAADLVALTSAFGEAAPLCLLEGMACGAVPVTTDVGDAAEMVGDPRLVTGREPEAVARAWAAAYDVREEHRARLLRGRQRLSDQRCFDAYAALVAAHVPVPSGLGLAG